MISVVIPLYNKKHTIRNTLNCVFSQTFENFEVIIVDDGSTDQGTQFIKNRFNDSRISIIKQNNMGVSVARNKGVEVSNYDYIAFLDADDEWKPNYLLKMKEAIDKYPEAGMFCCAGIIRNADGTEIFRLAKKYINKEYAEINFFENPHVFLHTSATVIKKKECLKTIGFPNGMKQNQDFAFFYSLALITPVIYCPEPLSVYVGGVEGQTTSTMSIEKRKHIISRYNHVFMNWLASNKDNDLFIIFTKYELRTEFLSHLKHRDDVSMNLVMQSLNLEILELFSSFEKKLYMKKYLRRIGIIYIYITKIIWRTHGFPRVGE